MANKEIASRFAKKIDEMAKIQQSVIEELWNNLLLMGPQTLIYDDDTPVVPIYYLNDDNDEGLFKIDQIKINEEGNIVFHDRGFNEWYRLSYLDYQAINTLIEYIDWK